ncbi:MAG: hypothetical protein ABIQ44_09220, partial [Chloroflexia bacterium]
MNIGHALHGSVSGDEMTNGHLAANAIHPTVTHKYTTSDEEAQTRFVVELRKATAIRYREIFKVATSPIRIMARMMAEAVAAAREEGISEAIIRRELVNRTIGDVNVRMITERINGVDYSAIGEDLGIILPGEQIGGRISDGAVHLELNRREEQIELRLLREYSWDLRIYDVFGVGNPLLRELLAARFERMWDIPVTWDKTFISIGALDALHKSILSLGHHFKKKYGSPTTFAFPSPGFAVVNWQVEMAGLKLLKVQTEPGNGFKL